MFWYPPEDRKAAGPPCVLDVALSLAPTGLFWVLGLSTALPVWLPQSHWAIVDDPEFYGRDDRLIAHLSGSTGSADAAATLGPVVRAWREARTTFGLETIPGCFWPGDGPVDSVFPKDGDVSLVHRLHALAAGLDNRRWTVSAPAPGTADALADCARDTLALAAALGGRRPVVLSPVGADGAPALARHLEDAGIACPRVTDTPLVPLVAEALMPALLASGLAVSLASGRLRLAALFIVAPGVLATDVLRDVEAVAEDQLEWNAAAEGGEAALWQDASAAWCEFWQ
ncbi:hypothetical protein QNA08_00960 [Chelatococcus sp. SYSU_G07232]|uniref:Uncharacterized protein n=1 Tax=Chelatococcus albus TaxID=3047466 RepID=A0ABT7ABT6_9HYPH|nr:hypothetical protein [Chelatococcus sp. SYSU_G07232]MDJ1156814.1 hypothetical protein [Chelatococcus sp. SYSU_G07232]